MRRRITLGIFALGLSTTALIGAATRRAEALPVCPLCQVGNHCCFIDGSPRCLPNSIPCP